jgi:hypothetical protein
MYMQIIYSDGQKQIYLLLRGQIPFACMSHCQNNLTWLLWNANVLLFAVFILGCWSQRRPYNIIVIFKPLARFFRGLKALKVKVTVWPLSSISTSKRSGIACVAVALFYGRFWGFFNKWPAIMSKILNAFNKIKRLLRRLKK